ncbi:hypothetical protein HYE03_03925 [Mycoplasmopsis bovis]|nr:hypothetical protein [Mycoplasmopsis bovis]QQH28151.1 hypothetical protein HYE03_03925 [Mycoplasmopsis bovis]
MTTIIQVISDTQNYPQSIVQAKVHNKYNYLKTQNTTSKVNNIGTTLKPKHTDTKDHNNLDTKYCNQVQKLYLLQIDLNFLFFTKLHSQFIVILV